MESQDKPLAEFIKAVAFAADKHRHQRHSSIHCHTHGKSRMTFSARARSTSVFLAHRLWHWKNVEKRIPGLGRFDAGTCQAF